MRYLDAADVQARLPWGQLIEALREAFRAGCETPVRLHYEVGEEDRTLLVMPAWQPQQSVGIKMITVFPSNASLGLPAIAGLYLLFDGMNGQPKAILDGGELTSRRTAAASALAASYLARPETRVMTMVGTGRLSRNIVQAHAAVRPIEEVRIWGRDAAKAEAVVRDLAESGIAATAVSDLEASVRSSDLVSCATLSKVALVRGAWLRPGTHLDLVGAYKPEMRETDAEVWAKAGLIAVDTREGTGHEAGDMIQAEAEGVPVMGRIAADLFQLTRGEAPGRSDPDAITIFKSVGASIEDLAAAMLAAG